MELWNDSTIDKYERNYANKLVELREIKHMIGRESMIEEMSRYIDTDQEQINLFQISSMKTKKIQDDQRLHSVTKTEGLGESALSKINSQNLFITPQGNEISKIRDVTVPAFK